MHESANERQEEIKSANERKLTQIKQKRFGVLCAAGAQHKTFAFICVHLRTPAFFR
jgi:hypothetical protein